MELIVLSDNFMAFMATKEGLKRLEGFGRFNFGAGGVDYTRQYFSANGKLTDIVSNVFNISYIFDRMKNNCVHDELAEISDMGVIGKGAVKEFVFVDFSTCTDGKYPAVKQSFTVKCTDRRPENGFLDYSGTLVGRGKPRKGYMILSEDLKSGEFISERSGILCD